MSKSGWLNDFEDAKDDVFNENLSFFEPDNRVLPAPIAVKSTPFFVQPPFFEVYQLIKLLCEID